MAGTTTKLNALPYDFITPGATGLYHASSGSLLQSSSSGDKMLMGYDTANKTLAVAQGGVVTTFCPSYTYKYDFTTQGGAVGTVTLKGPALPANFLITNAQLYTNVTGTSGGSATVSIGVASAADIKAATAIATIGAIGSQACIPILATPATHVAVATSAVPYITIAVAALTAGAFTLKIDGYVYSTDAT